MGSRGKLLLITGIVVGLSVMAFSAGAMLAQSGVFGSIDNKFGDQHLKTAVALVELHKTRFGEYPKDLAELRFIGDWDLGALHATEYCTNEEQTAYFVEVRRGWIGKPELSVPEEFWVGTGFDSTLGPCG